MPRCGLVEEDSLRKRAMLPPKDANTYSVRMLSNRSLRARILAHSQSGIVPGDCTILSSDKGMVEIDTEEV